MLRRVPLSIIRSFSLYAQQWYMSYRFADSRIRMELQFHPDPTVSKPVWHIPLLRVQWKTPDDGQSNCPKHAEFHSKNKCEKLVHLVGFIIRNLTRCTVTWSSNLGAGTLFSILLSASFIQGSDVYPWERQSSAFIEDDRQLLISGVAVRMQGEAVTCSAFTWRDWEIQRTLFSTGMSPWMSVRAS